MQTTSPATVTVRCAHLLLKCLPSEAGQVQAQVDAYQAELATLRARTDLSAVELFRLESYAWDRTIGTVL